MTYLYGMKVIAVDNDCTRTPKLQLSQGFNACSHECKRDMNAWLAERFGYENHVYSVGDTLFMSTAMLQQIRRTLK